MKTDSRLIFPSGDLATYENLLRVQKNIDAVSEEIASAESSEIHLVVYDSGLGYLYTAQTVKHGSKVTAPDDPTATGKTFSKWQKGGTDFAFTTPITENTVLTAVWTESNPS